MVTLVKDLDYIIVGSGIAGLHTAYRLNQQGKKVLVLEKEPYIGGRMSSHEINGNFIDFGAKFIASAYKHMLPLAKELGVKPVPINLTKAGIIKEGKLYAFNGKEKFAAVLSYRGISLMAKLQLGFAVLHAWMKYRKLDLYRLEDALYLDDKSAYDDFRDIAGPEAFDHVIESFSCNVLFYGTKDLSRGAFYSLVPKVMRMKTFTFPEGIGQLCEKMAAQVPMERNVEAKRVKRMATGVAVSGLKEGKEVSYKAKNVILAIPGSRVLDILENPSLEERSFFSQIRYASTVQILCEGRTDLFDKANVIWTLPKEDSNFTAVSNRGYDSPSADSVYFIAALRENTFRHLQKANNLDSDHLRSLILNEFPAISDLKIVRVQVWESATPKVYPGYIKSIINFLDRPDQKNGIYFCGDYLENPSTEGALTSSIKLLQRIV